MRPSRFHTASRSPGGQPLLLVLAVALLLAQLLFAAHMVDHLDADHADSCDICLVGNSLGHGHSGAALLPAPEGILPGPSAAPQPLLCDHPAPAPRQRDPPPQLRTA